MKERLQVAGISTLSAAALGLAAWMGHEAYQAHNNMNTAQDQAETFDGYGAPDVARAYEDWANAEAGARNWAAASAAAAGTLAVAAPIAYGRYRRAVIATEPGGPRAPGSA